MIEAAIFDFENLSLRFRDGRSLRFLAAQIPPASLVLINGPSGVGKTSLLYLLGLLERPLSVPGSHFLFRGIQGERDLLKRESVLMRACFWRKNRRAALRRRFGFLPQLGHLPHAFSQLEHLQMIHWLKGITADEQTLFSQLGLEILHSDLSPACLSGGQVQRLVLARALLGNPEVIFADEPTTYLDRELVGLCLKMLLQSARGGACVLMVTHELERVEKQLLAFENEGQSLPPLYRMELKALSSSGSEVVIKIQTQPLSLSALKRQI